VDEFFERVAEGGEGDDLLEGENSIAVAVWAGGGGAGGIGALGAGGDFFEGGEILFAGLAKVGFFDGGITVETLGRIDEIGDVASETKHEVQCSGNGCISPV
jgi:hypothetical protein